MAMEEQRYHNLPYDICRPCNVVFFGRLEAFSLIAVSFIPLYALCCIVRNQHLVGNVIQVSHVTPRGTVTDPRTRFFHGHPFRFQDPNLRLRSIA